ncbi:MAG TPA: AAA family ATPase, partial [Jiangellaceae bacterium]|nr:AAA family ATPase [Jiangellaceae bacterium]
MSPSLVGRMLEIDGILELVRSGGSLVVTGPPGIGKSSLLHEAEHAARARGMGVLSAIGVQSEAHLPYAGLHQLLRPVLDRIDRLPPPQRDAIQAAFGLREAEPPDLFLVGLGTLNLLTDEATNDGLLVIAEDAQWLDHGTGEVMAFVARRLGTDPVSLLIALREGHESPLSVAGLSEMRLEGLDEVAATELLGELAPDLPASVRDRLLEESAGNALALVELPAALASDQLAGAAPLPVVLPITERLERAFASRVQELRPETRAQLLIAALNDSGDLEEVLRASAVGDRKLGDLQTLEDAAASGLVDLDPTTLRFRHPLVRSAIVQMVSDADRRSAHERLADVLVDDPDRRAWHRAASIVGTDDDVASQLEAAAARAERRGGIATAVAGLERAAELSGDVGARGRRLMHAADLAFELGRRDLVGRLLQRAELLELGELERGRMTWIQEMVAPRIPGAAELQSLVHLADRSRTLDDQDLAMDVLWLVAQRCYWSAPGGDIRAEVIKAAASLGSLDDDPRLVAIVAYAAPIERGTAVVDHVSRAVSDHHET